MVNYTTGSGQYPGATPSQWPGYQEITRAEEFQDKITIMSPNDTPLLSLLPTRMVSNIDYSWMVDDIAAPSGVVGVGEGTTPTPKSTARQRLYNQAMLYHQGIDVTGTQRTQNEKGIDDEYSWHLVRGGLEVAKQFEWNLLYSDFLPRVGNTAGRTAGLVSWLAETGLAHADGTNPGSDGIIGASGGTGSLTVPNAFHSTWYQNTTASMSEDEFNDNILGPAWEMGTDINSSLIFVGSAVKRHMSKYGLVFDPSGNEQALTRMNVRSEEALRAITIDTWMTEFGVIHVCLNRYFTGTGNYTTNNYGDGAVTIDGNDMLVGLDPQFFSIPTLRPIQYAPLGKTKDSDEAYVVAEMGFQCDNPIAGFGASNIII